MKVTALSIILVSCLYLSWLHLDSAVNDFMKAEEARYQHYAEHVRNMSRDSAIFIKAAWQLPNANWHPTMVPWTFTNITFTYDHPECGDVDMSQYPILLVMYHGWYYVTTTGPDKKCWQEILVKDYLEVLEFNDSSSLPLSSRRPSARYPYSHITDSRLVAHNGRLFLTYPAFLENYGIINRFEHLVYEEVFYSEYTKNLYVIHPPTILTIRNEGIHANQRNWCNFFHTDSLGSTTEYFIYSIQPHRILKANGTDHASYHSKIFKADNATYLKFSTVYLSEIAGTFYKKEWNIHPAAKKSIDAGNPLLRVKGIPFWEWGHLRGGSPPVLIETPYGMKYISFFHTCASNLYAHSIKTYFMGAYLFEAQPPFQVSHISRQPIIPDKFYEDDALGPWATGAFNVVIFPIGTLITDDGIFVSLSYQDRSAWIIKLDKGEFWESLEPLRSKLHHPHATGV